MLLLHSIIVLGALIASSRARLDPYDIVARPDQEESNEIPRNSENFGVKGLPQETGDTKVCQSEECRRTAQEFLRNIDMSMNPCVNFFEYACNGWNQHNPIPATKKIWNQLKIIERRNMKRIRGILAEPEGDTDIAPVKAAKQFHKSCMDSDITEAFGLQSLEHILKENGGWPMIMEQSEWNSIDVSWKKVQENYQLLSRNASLFTVTVDADLDRNANVIKLKQTDPVKPYYTDFNPEEASNKRFNYTKYVEDVALTFAKSRNSNVSRKQISKDVADMIDFEKNLTELSIPGPNDKTHLMITIDTLQELYNKPLTQSKKSKINWLRTLQNLFKHVGIHVKSTDQILLSNYKFFTELAGLLEKTSKRTIVNYLHWKFVSSMMPYTNKKMRNMNYQLNKFIFGVTNEKPRWEECISENPLKDAVSYQIVHKYSPKKSKEKVLDMAKEIQDQIKNQISNADWMNDTSKSQAKEKLFNVAKFIGFPDWFNNASASIEFYKDLKMGPFYFENILNSNAFSLRKNLAKLRQPIDNTWLADPFTMNVYRDFIKNSLIFPATPYQLPLFGASRPNAVNYGAIGTIIGHELSKPFKELEYEYHRNDCFLHRWDNQFDMLEDFHYKYLEMVVRGSILDIAGLQAAYKAYQSKLADDGTTEEKLPGLENFSSQQIFFLSFANNWCESVRLTRFFSINLYTDISVARYMVEEALANIEGFSQAFQCPADTPMNHEVKCTLWD